MTDLPALVAQSVSPVLPDLASRAVGGSVVAANDEFFAPRENLITPEAPVFRPHTFTHKGQEYDGWETRRRRREPGDHDWAIVRLGMPGLVREVVVDTAFFTGNYPPFASVEGVALDDYPDVADLLGAPWQTLVPRSALGGNTPNEFTVDSPVRWTHVRLRIYPDGGVARLRVHGEPVPDPAWLDDVPFDLAALANGGRVVRRSDGFYSPPDNMLRPGEPRVMGDGWETARRRDGGNDWAVVRLAAPAVPRVLEIATTHYKGNAPDRVAVAGIDARGAESDDAALDDSAGWSEVLPPTRVQPDTTHRFRCTDLAVTHLRLDILPDGGIGRFRVYGALTADGRAQLLDRWRSTQPSSQSGAE
ncbi:MAG TPA: allantoicase [Pseudonocardiaceae bacterium]|nr:allantoicase [Pseudonocardiaceae bacterium]